MAAETRETVVARAEDFADVAISAEEENAAVVVVSGKIADRVPRVRREATAVTSSSEVHGLEARPHLEAKAKARVKVRAVANGENSAEESGANNEEASVVPDLAATFGQTVLASTASSGPKSLLAGKFAWCRIREPWKLYPNKSKPLDEPMLFSMLLGCFCRPGIATSYISSIMHRRHRPNLTNPERLPPPPPQQPNLN